MNLKLFMILLGWYNHEMVSLHSHYAQHTCAKLVWKVNLNILSRYCFSLHAKHTLDILPTLRMFDSHSTIATSFLQEATTAGEPSRDS